MHPPPIKRILISCKRYGIGRRYSPAFTATAVPIISEIAAKCGAFKRVKGSVEPDVAASFTPSALINTCLRYGYRSFSASPKVYRVA